MAREGTTCHRSETLSVLRAVLRPARTLHTVEFSRNGPGFLRLHRMLSRPYVMTACDVHRWPDWRRSRRRTYVSSAPLQSLGRVQPNRCDTRTREGAVLVAAISCLNDPY